MLLTRVLIAVLILSILLMGCDESGSSIAPDSQAFLEIHLLFAPGVQQANITRVVLTVSALDIKTLEFDLDFRDGKATNTIVVHAGENRLFTARAYSGEHVTHEGEEPIRSLPPGSGFSVELLLKPVGLSVEIIPSEITEPTGDTFGVEIEVGGVTDLFGYSFELEYNADLLEAIAVIQGGFLGNDAMFLSQIDTETISIAATRKAGARGVSGSGVIARITFRCLTPGRTQLRIIRNNDFAFQKEDGTDVDKLDQITIGSAGVTIE